ncbi:alpha/beta hydrolase [Fodinibius sediminis]|uniref:Alpha/beta hydrolase family protein n=1 Tax=Fodinibius sediminis TaxID=1214077 RepID=A0A521BUD0_9BACT|nr:alpha/beta hydrolase [Fodinibius sediminis]SMO50685.1 Alpha/beta hydrolase family protein [Fodinibius sediminis]
MWERSHPRELGLSDLDIEVTRIYGSNDGLASKKEIYQFAVNLTANTHCVRIAGGNYRQISYYGYQIGDGPADIPRKRQQEIMVDAIIRQLNRVHSK